MTRRCHFTGLLKSLIMDTLIGSLNSNSAGFRSEVCLSESPDIHFPVYWQFLSLPKSHTCFYHSFMVSIVKFPGAAWLRLISPCLYRDSVFNTASFSVATYTGITVFLVSVISMVIPGYCSRNNGMISVSMRSPQFEVTPTRIRPFWLSAAMF